MYGIKYPSIQAVLGSYVYMHNRLNHQNFKVDVLQKLQLFPPQVELAGSAACSFEGPTVHHAFRTQSHETIQQLGIIWQSLRTTSNIAI
jgi:hypothetical protein